MLYAFFMLLCSANNAIDLLFCGRPSEANCIAVFWSTHNVQCKIHRCTTFNCWVCAPNGRESTADRHKSLPRQSIIGLACWSAAATSPRVMTNLRVTCRDVFVFVIYIYIYIRNILFMSGSLTFEARGVQVTRRQRPSTMYDFFFYRTADSLSGREWRGVRITNVSPQLTKTKFGNHIFSIDRPHI